MASTHRTTTKFYCFHGKTCFIEVDVDRFTETRYRTRVVNNLHRRAKAFGFVLQPTEPKGSGCRRCCQIRF